jgi:ribosome-associated protein
MERGRVRTIRLAGGRVTVRPSDMLWQFVRSAGPGGQHVNRTSSKAVLRFAATSAGSMPEEVRTRLVGLMGPRLTREGDLVISSQRFRDQSRNVADCITKLTAILERACIPPRPRRKSRVPRSAIARRLDEKRRQSDKKRSRREQAD